MKKAVFAAAVLCASLAQPGPAQAQSTTVKFLQVPGIPGDSLDRNHRDWIDLLSFGQTLTPARGRRMTCQGEIVKLLDRASPALWAAVASGDTFPEMTIEIARAGADQAVFLQQKLLDVRIRRVSFQENGPVPAEALTLLPRSIVLRFTPQDQAGRPLPAIERTISCDSREGHHDDDEEEARRAPRALPRESLP
jgi:type VI secretion system Hcp family effector